MNEYARVVSGILWARERTFVLPGSGNNGGWWGMITQFPKNCTFRGFGGRRDETSVCSVVCIHEQGSCRPKRDLQK